MIADVATDSFEQLDLPCLEVLAVRLHEDHGAMVAVAVEEGTVLGSGDTLVLSGRAESLALAQNRLLRG